jgi:ribosomal protein S18 acetylase RimI-like enzyme
MDSSAENVVNYSLFTMADADEMARLLGDVFTKHDPLAVGVGLTSSEFDSFVRLFCAKAHAEQLTVVARSTETGEMIGALLTEDSASGPPDGMDQLSAKFTPIFHLLGELDAEYRSGNIAEPGESLHLFLLGVAQGFAGKGIAQQLVRKCIANGVLRRYREAVTEATSKTSQHIFRKHGFIERVRRSYGDYRFEGQAVFASVGEYGGPMLMTRELAK